MMKNRARNLILMVVTASLLLIPVPVAAQEFEGPFEGVCDDTTTSTGSNSVVCRNKDNEENPLIGEDGVLMRAVSILAWVIGIASVIIIIISGLKYITSNGDPKGIESAKNTLTYAIIGLFIFLFAQAILFFVIRRL